MTTRRARSRWIERSLGVWTVAVYVFLFLPIAFIVGHSFNENRDVFTWSRFSTQWYSSMIDNPQLTGAVRNSLIAAVFATLVSVVLGTLAGIALARRSGKWTLWFTGLVLLILTTPEIVDGAGMQLWFVQLGGIFRQGLFPVWFAQSIFSSAVVTLIVRARMSGLDESLEQAAADLYAPPVKAFFQITLPLVAPAILAGGLLAFTFSLDNVVVTNFVSVPGSTTFPVYVFGLARSVTRPEVAAMSTVMLGATLLALALVAFVLRKSGQTSSEIAGTLTGN
jgi:putrescine transport system permease protein